ncbi:hypothetical protein GCM10027073_32180 [Streptomyces chlorus]
MAGGLGGDLLGENTSADRAPRAHADNACEHEDRIVPAPIKGPADKSLKSGETVHLWDHQPED